VRYGDKIKLVLENSVEFDGGSGKIGDEIGPSGRGGYVSLRTETSETPGKCKWCDSEVICNP
jgi:hypothetical protein